MKNDQSPDFSKGDREENKVDALQAKTELSYVLTDLIGEYRQTINTAKEHLPALALEKSILVELVTLQAIKNIVVLERFGTGIEFRHPFVGWHPQITGRIFHDGINNTVRQAVFFCVTAKDFSPAVKFIQSTARAYP